MTADSLTIAAGCGVGLGLALIAAEILPSHPDLYAALDRLNATTPTPQTRSETWPARVTRLWAARIPAPIAGACLARVTTNALSLVGRTREWFLVSKVGVALATMLLPPVGAAGLNLVGLHLPLTASVATSLVLAALFFQLPDIWVRRCAARAREEFTRTIGSYLVLIALERGADAGLNQALLRAADTGRSWPWARIRDALHRALLDRRPMWNGLHDLVEEVGVAEVRDVADIIQASDQDGTAIYDSLLARARSLRTELVTRRQAQANADSERMVIPVALLGLSFIALLAYPVISRITTG